MYTKYIDLCWKPEENWETMEKKVKSNKTIENRERNEEKCWNPKIKTKRATKNMEKHRGNSGNPARFELSWSDLLVLHQRDSSPAASS